MKILYTKLIFYLKIPTMGLLFKRTKKTTIETEDNEPYQPIRSQAIDWLVHGV